MRDRRSQGVADRLASSADKLVTLLGTARTPSESLPIQVETQTLTLKTTTANPPIVPHFEATGAAAAKPEAAIELTTSETKKKIQMTTPTT